MKILLDMNLSPVWVEALVEAGIEAQHWSTVGDGRATDKEIEELHWSAIITYRGDRVRIISVRRSRREEVTLYEG